MGVSLVWDSIFALSLGLLAKNGLRRNVETSDWVETKAYMVFKANQDILRLCCGSSTETYIANV